MEQIKVFTVRYNGPERGYIMLYNTETELFYNDYKPLFPLAMLSDKELKTIFDNVSVAAENAFLYGSDLLLDKLLSDMEAIQEEQDRRQDGQQEKQPCKASGSVHHDGHVSGTSDKGTDTGSIRQHSRKGAGI